MYQKGGAVSTQLALGRLPQIAFLVPEICEEMSCQQNAIEMVGSPEERLRKLGWLISAKRILRDI